MNQVLALSFMKGDGTKLRMTVPHPREDVTGAEVKTAMDEIIASDVFAPGGIALTGVDEARIISTQEDVLELV
ncbi:hypothetical protein Amet_0720 [Alkaliphilus metalliredigens QYMF]|uniref:DUF2922 domain-containing protein n=1 Tax=Alkaliphilus metalliredigens (strain QYMF) TaxID=293826 RepID=A6TL77_ALKMQ|nr:DUF2922 domain-containing protein [Alkaliphilus metalliredigens]ABR46945.1 hypothetical protein Amet_0720 [Alkaliphilus metalliredigens QYMF]